ncbi:hypothetical protein LK533_13520 [Sphingomonas sp. PL-96]|uniref:hypothetical protein n=1 Tax=Sphingomonas sp. PL-96 TaxID=2887201 RepID=UPI001E3237CC|nr:hypothetical protein [Sphingomonas sp. PL-96]MCC2977692.1 hypothetical protein [Sphingomonas sp. PL-96]
MTMETASSATGAPRKPRGNTMLWVAILAFVLGLAAMAVLVHRFGARIGLGPAATPPALQSQPQPAPTQGARLPVRRTPDVDTLSQRETVLAAHIAELEARLANVDTSSRVASGFATRAEGLLVAFAARRALDRGLALDYIEDQLRERFAAAEPQAVATVIAAARQPVTLEDLRLALDTIAPKLSGGGPNESWWQGIRRELSQLVIIRQDASPSMLPADRLARARRRLDAAQVEGALAEIARMPGAANAQSWMDAARRYIAARQALNTIETVAIQGRGTLPLPPMPAAPPPAAGSDDTTSGEATLPADPAVDDPALNQTGA